MIILKIEKPGHVINIPGLPIFRSPVEINISKIDTKIIAMYLQNANILEYKVLKTKTQTKKNNWKKKLTKIERRFGNLTKKNSKQDYSQEQIKNIPIEKTKIYVSNVHSKTVSIINDIKMIKQNDNLENFDDILISLMKKNDK